MIIAFFRLIFSRSNIDGFVWLCDWEKAINSKNLVVYEIFRFLKKNLKKQS